MSRQTSAHSHVHNVASTSFRDLTAKLDASALTTHPPAPPCLWSKHHQAGRPRHRPHVTAFISSYVRVVTLRLFSSWVFAHLSAPPNPPAPPHDSERSREAFGVGLGLLAVGSVPLESRRNKEQHSGREIIPGQILWTSNSRERCQQCQISDRTEAACLFCFGGVFSFLTPPLQSPFHPFIGAIDTPRGFKP